MKLHVFSDLHFDASPGGWIPELAPGADAVLCAGDVCEGLPEAFRFLREFIPEPTPIITVAGNHSFYRRVMPEEVDRARIAAAELDIAFLENEVEVIGGVRFIGATLWTDYALYGDADRVPAVIRAERAMNDHQCIARRREPLERFTAADAANLHATSLREIDRLLTEPFAGPTVVLTHHAPHPGSIAERYHGDGLNPAFASNLGGLIFTHEPFAWVHGHTHASADYRIGATRILCNPHGYGRENASGFDPALILDTEVRS
ncbi:metallophosphoesterase [Methylobacterium sp. D53M]